MELELNVTTQWQAYLFSSFNKTVGPCLGDSLGRYLRSGILVIVGIVVPFLVFLR